MDIDESAAAQAFEEARLKFPGFAAYSARLVARPLFKGFAFQLEWEDAAARNLPDAWEYQNAVVRAYRRITGV
jgi:hypothetical protein